MCISSLNFTWAQINENKPDSNNQHISNTAVATHQIVLFLKAPRSKGKDKDISKLHCS